MSESEPEIPQTIAFDYLKSRDFRVIKVDGTVGSITPSGDIFIALYNERKAIPQRLVFSVEEDGNIGDEILSERVSRDGFVRELEIGASMSVETAENLVEWLNELIEEFNSFATDDEDAVKEDE